MTASALVSFLEINRLAIIREGDISNWGEIVVYDAPDPTRKLSSNNVSYRQEASKRNGY